MINERMWVAGRIIKLKVTENFPGLMEKTTRGTMLQILNTDLVDFNGQMVKSTKANGKMVNNMVKELI